MIKRLKNHTIIEGASQYTRNTGRYHVVIHDYILFELMIIIIII